ncbi:MAG: hypothetical protein ACXW6K_19475, partial [Candidatus Binatia bacterium]
MAQVLSQDEIDALLGGIATQQVATSDTAAADWPTEPESAAPPARTSEFKPYDFSRRDISSRGRLPGLEGIL